MVYNTRSYTRNQRIIMLNKLNEELRSNSYDIKNNKPNNQNYTELEVNIDFEHASKEWRKNKIQLKEGMFRYIQK